MFGSNARKNPSLPQNDSPAEQQKREDQLASSKKTYIWDDNVTNVEGVPMSKNVPFADQPTISWILKVADVALQVAKNAIAAGIKNDGAMKDLRSIESRLEEIKNIQKQRDNTDLKAWLEETLAEAKQLLSLDISTLHHELDNLKKLIKEHPVSEKIASQEGLAPYKDLFATIELNPLAEEFQEDSIFSYYRVGGPNPMLIQCINELPDNFPVTDEGYQSYMGSDDSLSQALSDNRLFMLDYKELQIIVDNPGDYDGLSKQVFAPLALFAKAKGGEALLPVAIQRTQVAADYPIVYATEDQDSADYWRWQTAKSIVQMAEGNYHELIVHLARTHLFIEAFTVATHRNLADNHPINILLIPHFEGTLFINNSAATSLIAPNGPIDQIFAGKISSTQQMAGEARLNYDFYENMLPTDLKNRRVDDPKVLPNYPYRDDALLVWDSIENWAKEYVNIYYDNDEAVVGDTELAAWAADLSGEGKVKGFRPIESKDQLVQVLTMIIFTSSAQHAAVNFPQSSIMTYAPAISGAVWGEKDTKGETEQEWLQTLPPLKLASEQLNLLHLLGGVYYRMLGNYQTNEYPYRHWFEDKQIIGKGQALERFQQSLADVEDEINQRNNNRTLPYTYLLPSKIPMSINI